MSDRAAIITGASSGIGLAIAHVLGEEGYALTAAARRPEKLAAAPQELRDAGFEVEEVAGNMADEDDIQRVVAAPRRRAPDQARGPPARGQPARDRPLLPRVPRASAGRRRRAPQRGGGQPLLH